MKSANIILASILIFGGCANLGKQIKKSTKVTATKPKPAENKPKNLLPKQTPPQTETKIKELIPLTSFRDPFNRTRLKMLLRGTGRIRVNENGMPFYGTGTCIAPKTILTAAHLPYEALCDKAFEEATLTTFTLDETGTFLVEDKTIKLELLAYNTHVDLALYKITDESFACRPIVLEPSNNLTMGEIVFRFGFNAGWTYTQGVYAKSMLFALVQPPLMHDYYVISGGPGSSGGPVVNDSGKLVGIISKGLPLNDIEFDNGDDQVYIKIGQVMLGIPLTMIKNFLATNKHLIN